MVYSQTKRTSSIEAHAQNFLSVVFLITSSFSVKSLKLNGSQVYGMCQVLNL